MYYTMQIRRAHRSDCPAAHVGECEIRLFFFISFSFSFFFSSFASFRGFAFDSPSFAAATAIVFARPSAPSPSLPSVLRPPPQSVQPYYMLLSTRTASRTVAECMCRHRSPILGLCAAMYGLCRCIESQVTGAVAFGCPDTYLPTYPTHPASLLLLRRRTTLPDAPRPPGTTAAVSPCTSIGPDKISSAKTTVVGCPNVTSAAQPSSASAPATRGCRTRFGIARMDYGWAGWAEEETALGDGARKRRSHGRKADGRTEVTV